MADEPKPKDNPDFIEPVADGEMPEDAALGISPPPKLVDIPPPSDEAV